MAGVVVFQKLLFQNVFVVTTPAACPNITKAVLGVNVVILVAVVNLEFPMLTINPTVSIGLIVSTPAKLTIAAAPPVAPVPSEKV